MDWRCMNSYLQLAGRGVRSGEDKCELDTKWLRNIKSPVCDNYVQSEVTIHYTSNW